MNVAKVAVLCLVLHYAHTTKVNPTLKLQAFKPRGFRVTGSWNNNITFFSFKGFCDSRDQEILIRGYGRPFTNMKWIYEDLSVKFEIGDIISHQAFFSTEKSPIIINSTFVTMMGVLTEFKIFVVNKLVDYPGTAPKENCKPSRTRVRDGYACKGETLFKDDFNHLDTDQWMIEHYVPLDHPEAPFVSYQRLRSNPTVYVEEGMLYIQPRLQQDLPGFTNETIIAGALDLSTGCTRPTCVYQAMGSIIPPVVSGRVTSARFAFTYGVITVRAKLPQGDWLYPEILLEPLGNKYGSINYASGVLKIAMALGNKDVDMNLYSNKYLKGWPIMNGKCRTALQTFSSPAPYRQQWGDEFHEYTMIWTPDSIEFGVDGKIYGRFEPGAGGLRSWLPPECRELEWLSLLDSGDPMAPFDQNFFITLGVAAGGVVEFPDHLRSRGYLKPWKNQGKKASVKFWEALSDWYPTWNKSALVIDFIKVDAL